MVDAIQSRSLDKENTYFYTEKNDGLVLKFCLWMVENIKKMLILISVFWK